MLGERLSRSAFLGDERIDSERRLNAVLAALDAVPVASGRSAALTR